MMAASWSPFVMLASKVTALPKAEQAKPHWRELIMAAEHGGIVMLAWIAMRQALIEGKPVTPPATRKKAAKKFRVIR